MYTTLRNCLLVFALNFLAILSAPCYAGNDDPLGYEQALKQHHLKLSQYARSLQSLSLTANQSALNITYYDIAIRIEPLQSTIHGAVSVYGKALQPLEAIELNLEQHLVVDSTTIGGTAANFHHQGNILSIESPPLASGQSFEIAVFYHGTPVREGFGSFTFGYHNELPVITTLSEPFFARNWWSCKDHPSDKADSVDMRITTDDRIIAVSNGKLISISDNGDGTRTTHWHESYPIATYLVSLAIADYEEYSDTFRYAGHSMPVDFHILSGNVEFYRENNSKIVPMLEFFSSIYGEYPFIRERYGHAETFFGGGMEHQTCASIGVFHEWLLAHELAHQWWGDLITCGTWYDIWLNEGFARYSEALWLEHTQGPESYHQYMNSLIHLDQQVYVPDTTDYNDIFDRVVYDKGALVLHMLRYLVGKDTFFQIIRTYANSQHKYGSATTADFQAICEQVSQLDLDYFFAQWVYQPSIPDYRFGTFAFETDSGWVADLQLRQVQTQYPVFIADLDVRFFFESDSLTFRVTNDKVKQNYRFLLPEEPLDCKLDPDNWIIDTSAAEPLSLEATVDTLPTAAVGLPYSFRLSALGGLPPFHWSEFVISMPEGMSISDDGLLAGIPVVTGSSEIIVRIEDSSIPPRETTEILFLQTRQVRGNIDSQAGLALGDLLYFVRYLYLNGPEPPDPIDADANCDGDLDIRDIVTILNFLYQQGPLPCFAP